MTGSWLEKIYAWGRGAIPLRWRRAIRRRIPVEKFFRIRKPAFAAGLPPSRREDLPGRPDVFVLSHGEWNFRRQRSQQLASAVAGLGGRVFFAELGAQAPTSPEPGVLLVPVSGARREDLYERALQDERLSMALASLRAAKARFSIVHAAVLVQLPYWRPLAEAARTELGWKIVYDCMDDHSAFSTVRGAFVDEEERRLAHGADLVVASSQKLLEKMSSLHGPVLLLRNAADFDFFSPASARPFGPRPRVGYFGAVSEWFDLDLVAFAARRHPGWDFEIVGSTFGSEAAKVRLPNLRFTGEAPYTELPGRLAGFDVCVIPFRIGPLVEATNPVKAYEMLASGKPVVATPIPELAPLAAEGLVRLASGAEEFESQLAGALEEDDPGLRARRMEFARTNSWKARARELLQAMRALYAPASVVVVTYDNLEFNRACLSSLLSETDWPNLELVFVDNGSKDGTREWLLGERARTPELRVVINGENLGFAPAVNRGIAASSGSFLCLLNNDTVVTRGWLSALLAHLESNRKLGLVGASTNEIANEARVPVSYSTLSELREWASGFTEGNRGRFVPLPMAAMFCTAFRRALYDEVGPLDERFSVGMFEDDDYSRRVRDAGYEIACARDSFVHHRGRASFQKLGEERYLAVYRENERRFREKWGDAPSGRADLDELPNSLREVPGVVVFLPSIGWNVTLVQRPHHLARALARAGRPVVFDCSGSGEIDPFEGFREIEPRLFLYRGPREVLFRLRSPILWAFAYNVPELSEWPPGARLVYDAIDDLSVFPHARGDLRRRHARALRDAGTIFAVSRPLVEEIRVRRPDAVYLPNGVDAAVFEAAGLAERRAGENTGSVAGYVGALARWIDYELLREVIRNNPGWEFRFVGQPLDESWSRSRLEESPNVRFLGPRPHASMPETISSFDVGMIPFRRTRETRAVSPLKLYEYFAAGRPVVATGLPELSGFGDLVLIGEDAATWPGLLERARSRGREPGFRARLRAAARESDWSVRAGEALSHLV